MSRSTIVGLVSLAALGCAANKPNASTTEQPTAPKLVLTEPARPIPPSLRRADGSVDAVKLLRLPASCFRPSWRYDLAIDARSRDARQADVTYAAAGALLAQGKSVVVSALAFKPPADDAQRVAQLTSSGERLWVSGPDGRRRCRLVLEPSLRFVPPAGGARALLNWLGREIGRVQAKGPMMVLLRAAHEHISAVEADVRSALGRSSDEDPPFDVRRAGRSLTVEVGPRRGWDNPRAVKHLQRAQKPFVALLDANYQRAAASAKQQRRGGYHGRLLDAAGQLLAVTPTRVRGARVLPRVTRSNFKHRKYCRFRARFFAFERECRARGWGRLLDWPPESVYVGGWWRLDKVAHAALAAKNKLVLLIERRGLLLYDSAGSSLRLVAGLRARGLQRLLRWGDQLWVTGKRPALQRVLIEGDKLRLGAKLALPKALGARAESAGVETLAARGDLALLLIERTLLLLRRSGGSAAVAGQLSSKERIYSAALHPSRALAYLGGDDGVRVVDLAQPAAPRVIQQLRAGIGKSKLTPTELVATPRAVFANGGGKPYFLHVLALAEGGRRLEPRAAIGDEQFPANSGGQLLLLARRLWLATSDSIVALDVRDLRRPRRLVELPHEASWLLPLAGQLLAVTRSSGLMLWSRERAVARTPRSPGRRALIEARLLKLAARVRRARGNKARLCLTIGGALQASRELRLHWRAMRYAADLDPKWTPPPAAGSDRAGRRRCAARVELTADGRYELKMSGER